MITNTSLNLSRTGLPACPCLLESSGETLSKTRLFPLKQFFPRGDFAISMPRRCFAVIVSDSRVWRDVKIPSLLAGDLRRHYLVTLSQEYC